jgi:hypothetical protein
VKQTSAENKAEKSFNPLSLELGNCCATVHACNFVFLVSILLPHNITFQPSQFSNTY